MKIDIERLTHLGVFLGMISIGLIAGLSSVLPEIAYSPAINTLFTGICVLWLAVLFAGRLRGVF